MKLLAFSILSIGSIFTKLLVVSERLRKIKVNSYGSFFVIWLTLAIICNQRLFHGNKIVQYLPNCKCYNAGQDLSEGPYKVL